MLMTDEQKKLDNLFQDFLAQLDIVYADYFTSDKIGVNSIKECFATVNGDKLRYVSGRNLRQDIYNIVVDKHQELWGDLHDFRILD
ncbi:MAG: hypothetical protein IPH18_00555 [Chitinophagaceae bacterium]|nr:hypothetical protein [Chitinophagaceae bacterium]